MGVHVGAVFPHAELVGLGDLDFGHNFEIFLLKYLVN